MTFHWLQTEILFKPSAVKSFEEQMEAKLVTVMAAAVSDAQNSSTLTNEYFLLEEVHSFTSTYSQDVKLYRVNRYDSDCTHQGP